MLYGFVLFLLKIKVGIFMIFWWKIKWYKDSLNLRNKEIGFSFKGRIYFLVILVCFRNNYEFCLSLNNKLKLGKLGVY